MLTIRNIRQGDGGSYSCKATNKAGSQERELFLKVFGEDVFTSLIVALETQTASSVDLMVLVSSASFQDLSGACFSKCTFR